MVCPPFEMLICKVPPPPFKISGSAPAFPAHLSQILNQFLTLLIIFIALHLTLFVAFNATALHWRTGFRLKNFSLFTSETLRSLELKFHIPK